VATSGRLGPIPGELRQTIEIAERGTLRLVRAVNDILEIEELSTGIAPMRFAAEDVALIVGRADDAASIEARDRGVTLTGSALDAAVYADADRIVRALATLLLNAVRATPAGGSVRLSVAEHAGWICYEIADTGVQMPREQAALLFEPFGADRSANPRHAGGSALTLGVARLVVERHGGEISFDSTPDGGLYRVRIPSSVGWLNAIALRPGAERLT
jgi:signal transduction histidine kinase